MVFLSQSELDGVNSLLSEAEGKNIKSSKDLSTVESQLQDTQVRLRGVCHFKTRENLSFARMVSIVSTRGRLPKLFRAI